jgi:hypothetical protein
MRRCDLPRIWPYCKPQQMNLFRNCLTLQRAATTHGGGDATVTEKSPGRIPVSLTAAPVTVNQDMKALVPRRETNTKYLAWALRGISHAVFSIVEEFRGRPLRQPGVSSHLLRYGRQDLLQLL